MVASRCQPIINRCRTAGVLAYDGHHSIIRQNDPVAPLPLDSEHCAYIASSCKG